MALMKLVHVAGLVEVIPAFKVMAWRTVPFAASSTLPYSIALRGDLAPDQLLLRDLNAGPGCGPRWLERARSS